MSQLSHNLSHKHVGDHDYCEACGQKLPRDGYGYGGPRKHNRYGLAVTVALHVAVLVAVLFSPKLKIPLKNEQKKAGEMVWISPVSKTKPTPKPEPKPESKPVQTAKSKPTPRSENKPVAKAAPPKQETFVPPVQATMKPPPLTPVQEDDMMARVDAARKRRAQDNPQPQAEPQESENDRAKRVARANIMGAQGRNAAGEREDSGGMFTLLNRTSLSADLKFRGWNTNFKRQWSKMVHVELGGSPDIETAVVRKMIELIREEKTGEFEWDSHRLGRVVKMNAGRQYQAELEAFLMKEMFSENRGRG